MSSVRSTHGRLLARALVVSIGAVLLLTVALTDIASAHGSVVDPASRNYGCWQRWGDNHQAPEMQTEDPMCYQAWQDNPNAMWNWNGLFRENVGGNHQGAIPDGTLCSGGQTDGGRYNSLDALGPWTATQVNNSFNVRLFDGASHGADYIRVYVTRQGYDALTEPLSWSDLELVGQIGDTPASQWRQEQDGVSIDIPANAAGRTGRHVVYTIWQASHLDQSYYLCSDVIFPGGSNPPPPPTSPPPPPPTSPPPPPPTSPPPPPPAGACSASYSLVSSWSSGFQGEVEVTAGASAITGWSVTMTFADGQVEQGWNATFTPSGSSVTATNAAYNGALAAGASTTFGFLGTGSGESPTLTCTAS